MIYTKSTTSKKNIKNVSLLDIKVVKKKKKKKKKSFPTTSRICQTGRLFLFFRGFLTRTVALRQQGNEKTNVYESKPFTVAQDDKDQPGYYSRQIRTTCSRCWYLNRETTPKLSPLTNQSHVL